MNLAISRPRLVTYSVFCSSVPFITASTSASGKGVEPEYPRRVMETNRRLAAGASEIILLKLTVQNRTQNMLEYVHRMKGSAHGRKILCHEWQIWSYKDHLHAEEEYRCRRRQVVCRSCQPLEKASKFWLGTSTRRVLNATGRNLKELKCTL